MNVLRDRHAAINEVLGAVQGWMLVTDRYGSLGARTCKLLRDMHA